MLLSLSWDFMRNLDYRLVPFLVSALSVTISLVASAHVILNKRDTRSAIGWIGLIWLSPFLGTMAYVLLGINRINRKAQSLRRGRPRLEPPPALACPPEEVARYVADEDRHLVSLARLVGEVTGRPLLEGNEIVPLMGGDQAFPAMIRAIDEASRSVSLVTYIFNDDRAGRLFVDALKRAVDRGVAVRVLVDGIGARYDWPSITRVLRNAGVPFATFIPTLVPGWTPYLNLRNHRKILVADGRVGFTGGMNIDEDYFHQIHPRRPRNDLHFRVEGPVVAHLQHVFAEDWVFTTQEFLQGDLWFPALDPVGPVLSRGISDGPDEDLDKLIGVILGALACAETSVAIVTPYFLPDAPLISALTIAAMRGVQVDIILPKQNNLNLVKWASTALLGELIERGCRVWYSPPPFDHSKLMVVDDIWSFVGSGNWDPRSLRLNFEFNLECYGPALAASLGQVVRDKLRDAERVTMDDIKNRSLPVKLRDGTARLLSPYL
jgi:cardiolipin synthase